MIDVAHLTLAGLAALAAGAVNALAGGGTLITFPALVALGIPPVVANVTNTVALCPGYLGGTLAQKGDLRRQGRRLWILLPGGLVGGIAGGLLLLHTREKLFGDLVPYLILLGSVLLAIQDPVRVFLRRRAQAGSKSGSSHGATIAAAFLPLALASVYGGYFGAGLSVILLATLALVLEDSLTRLNALKQAIAFAANIGAAVVFVSSGRVAWPVAAVMAVAALLGGAIGGRLAGRVPPVTLRWVVVGLGTAVAVVYLAR